MNADLAASHYTGIAGFLAVTVMVLIAAVVAVVVIRLRQKLALLDGLFEQIPQAIVFMQADSRVVRVNMEFTRVFGYSPQEAQGRLLTELIVPERWRDESERNVALVSLGDRVDIEAVRQRKDGSRLHVLVAGVPVSVPGGQIALCATYRDITQRKVAETALRALSIRLLEVQENERRHLARELHDEIGQLLTGLGLLLGPNRGVPPDTLDTRSEQARSIVDELLARVRRLSFDLRPADLDQLGMLPALLSLFERYTMQTGVLVNFKHQGADGRFAPELETVAYRTVQEALTNAARHAGVAGITVRVWTEPDMLNLQIEDRGCGFNLNVVGKAPGSSGLAGMQERITLLGGDVTIESSPGAGTTITAGLPLNRKSRLELE